MCKIFSAIITTYGKGNTKEIFCNSSYLQNDIFCKTSHIFTEFLCNPSHKKRYASQTCKDIFCNTSHICPKLFRKKKLNIYCPSILGQFWGEWPNIIPHLPSNLRACLRTRFRVFGGGWVQSTTFMASSIFMIIQFLLVFMQAYIKVIKKLFFKSLKINFWGVLYHLTA